MGGWVTASPSFAVSHIFFHLFHGFVFGPFVVLGILVRVLLHDLDGLGFPVDMRDDDFVFMNFFDHDHFFIDEQFPTDGERQRHNQEAARADNPPPDVPPDPRTPDAAANPDTPVMPVAVVRTVCQCGRGQDTRQQNVQ